MRNFYNHNYDRRNRYRSNSGDRRISFSGRIQYGQNYRDRPKYRGHSEQESLEGICDQIRILEVKIIEVDIEGILEMIIMKEVKVGLGIGNIKIIPEGMKEVMVGLDQDQEQALIEIGLDAMNVENVIILLRTAQLQKQKENKIKYNKCIWMKNKPH